MIGSKEERMVFEEIQRKLFYMIPEKWESIHLYAAIIEEPFQKSVGEMYFYYFPKGILKKDPVNVYEIPALFNIDEQSYNELIDKLYNDIRKLRKIAEENHPNLWSNITITIKNSKFHIEYDYTDLSDDSEFTAYERHVIWRYRNLNIDLSLETKEDRYIISKYHNYLNTKDLPETEEYVEGIYMNPVSNIIDYEKTMTLEAALAMKKQDDAKREKELEMERLAKKEVPKGKNKKENIFSKIKVKEKMKRDYRNAFKTNSRSRKKDMDDENEDFLNNQILFRGNSNDDNE